MIPFTIGSKNSVGEADRPRSLLQNTIVRPFAYGRSSRGGVLGKVRPTFLAPPRACFLHFYSFGNLPNPLAFLLLAVLMFPTVEAIHERLGFVRFC